MNPVEMMQAINHALLETTMASTSALVLVLLARRRLRVAFGASVAYAAWLLVPIASIAVLLPAAPADSASIPVVYRFVAQPMQAVVTGAEPSIALATWLCSAWLLGTLAMLLYFIRQQQQFKASLGRLLVRGAGVLQADAVAGLPAAIGLLNPVIVLPADFETRYSDEQRDLMLVHERAHIRHGDLHANAGLLALRCVFWFNPLLHLAARAFRHDQELACDQRVIARHPTSRRAYGEAMFRTQLAAQALPLGCHWGFTHPLKERIEMLRTSLPSSTRRTFGTSILAVSVLFVGAAAWAAQAPVQAKSGVTSKAAPIRSSQVTAPPAYPKDERDQKIEGSVLLIVDVAADGTVTKVELERGSKNSNLDREAATAVAKWKFTPEIKDGKAVAGRVRVPVEFRMDSDLPPPPPPRASPPPLPPPPPPPPPPKHR